MRLNFENSLFDPHSQALKIMQSTKKKFFQKSTLKSYNFERILQKSHNHENN